MACSHEGQLVLRRPCRHHKLRTDAEQAEIEQIVCEFESSGLNRSQFCRRQGLTLGVLNRYLQRRAGPKQFLENFHGILQTDAYQAYDKVGGRGLSVIETCRRLKVSARDYLSAVLPGLANTRLQRLPNLTPTAWAAQHQ